MTNKKDKLIHFHGASIGEVSCLLVALKRLQQIADLNGCYLLLTFTSRSAELWLSRNDIPRDLVCRRYGRGVLGELKRWSANGRFREYKLVVAEKDRRIGLMKFYSVRGSICNIEAKPPQSRLSVIFELAFAKSMRMVDEFLVENEDYRRQIEDFARCGEVVATGTLKAVRKGGPPRELGDRRRVVFISVLEQELNVLRRTINVFRKADAPILSLVVPRYVGRGLPGKNGKSFLVKARTLFPGARFVSEMGELRSELASPGGVVVYRNLGDVERILGECDVAIVCGSLEDSLFVKAKGHNVFESLAQSIPTFIGPKHQNWRSSVERLKREGVLMVTAADQLGERVLRLLGDPVRYKELSKRIARNEYVKMQRRSDRVVARSLCSFLGLASKEGLDAGIAEGNMAQKGTGATAIKE